MRRDEIQYLSSSGRTKLRSIEPVGTDSAALRPVFHLLSNLSHFVKISHILHLSINTQMWTSRLPNQEWPDHQKSDGYTKETCAPLEFFVLAPAVRHFFCARNQRKCRRKFARNHFFFLFFFTIIQLKVKAQKLSKTRVESTRYICSEIQIFINKVKKKNIKIMKFQRNCS